MTHSALIPYGSPIHGLSTISTNRSEDMAPVTAAERLRAWLARLGHNTQRAYQRDLAMFASHMGESRIGEALDRLCAMPRARALTLVERWRDDMRATGLSSATINRRLASVNSALREIAKADIGPGRLDLEGVKPEPRKDTRGPAIGKVAVALEKMIERGRPIDIRDAAIIRLCAQRGLRRSEVTNLQVADFNVETSELRILRKGRVELTTIQIAGPTADAIKSWLAVRGDWAAPGCTSMFVALEYGKREASGISGDAIYQISRRHCGSRPHGLRHTAITNALKATGNLEAAREFAGHKSVSTTQVYLDDRREVEREAVAALGEMF